MNNNRNQLPPYRFGTKVDVSNKQIQSNSHQAMQSKNIQQQQQYQMEQGFNFYQSQQNQQQAGQSKIRMAEVIPVNAAMSRNEQTQSNLNTLKQEDNSKMQYDQYQKPNQSSTNPFSHNTYFQCDDQPSLFQQKQKKIQTYHQGQSHIESPLLQQGNFNNLTHQNSQQSSKNELSQSTSELKMEMLELKQENQQIKKELEQQKQIQSQRDYEYRNKFEEFERFMKISQRNIGVESDQQKQQKSEIKQELELYVANILKSQQNQLTSSLQKYELEYKSLTDQLKQQIQELLKKQEQDISYINELLNNHEEDLNIIKTKILEIDPIPGQINKIGWLQVEENSIFDFEEANCCHCQQKIIERQQTLQCGHIYHQACIIQVISQQLNNSCLPQCFQCKNKISIREIQGFDNSFCCEKIFNLQLKLIKDKMTYSECKNCSFFWESKYFGQYQQCEQCEQQVN